jgi:hypothetical protein
MMSYKLRLLNLILIVIFVFSFTACAAPETVPATAAAETTTIETTAPKTTIPETIAAVTTIPETTAAATTAAETTAAETTAAETTAASTTVKNEYIIGGTGPAGGMIFYVNPDYETDGWQYLETAPVNTEWPDMQWSNVTATLAGAEATAIGTGKTNTAAIVGQSGHSSSAAKLCDDLKSGGYSDWFLPSGDELNLMYTNLKVAGLGGFTAGYYWSSSEVGAKYALLLSFSNGSLSNGSKDYTAYVRAVRAF